jgi:hypothetical protein
MGNQEFRFTLILRGAPPREVTRLAPSISDALSGSLAEAESSGEHRVLRIEPDDLVTAAEIAERLGRSRESIRLLAAGERDPGGGFPLPVSHAASRQRLWRWSEVAKWAGLLTPEEVERARYIAAVNAALELRALAPEPDPLLRRLVHEVLPAPSPAPETGTLQAPSATVDDDARVAEADERRASLRPRSAPERSFWRRDD